MSQIVFQHVMHRYVDTFLNIRLDPKYLTVTCLESIRNLIVGIRQSMKPKGDPIRRSHCGHHAASETERRANQKVSLWVSRSQWNRKSSQSEGLIVGITQPVKPKGEPIRRPHCGHHAANETERRANQKASLWASVRQWKLKESQSKACKWDPIRDSQLSHPPGISTPRRI